MRLGDQLEESGGQRERDDRVPRLVAGIDAMSLALSPDEGFLLSRIDGHTPLRVLRQMGLPPDAVERFLGQWIEEGWVHFTDEPGEEPPETDAGHACDSDASEANASDADASRADGPGESAPEVETADVADALPEIDESLELPVKVQERLLELMARIDRPYHEILGIPIDADNRAIKKAYFTLSKVFHPDRYFRRKLGPFEELVDRCFKRVLEAYELLSDPVTRKEVQREARVAARDAASALASSTAKSLRSDPARMRKRLDQLSGQGRIREQRRRKAKTFFEAGVAAFAKEKWLEAAGSVRLAIAFDAKNELYREKFVEVQRQAHVELAKMRIAKAEAALSLGDYAEAMTHFEEAVHYRPADADLHMRAARVAWQGVKELKSAKDLALAACELDPDNAGYHRTLGQIYAAAGLESNARRELRRALELDPNDGEARVALKSI